MESSSIPAKIPQPFATEQVGGSLFNTIPNSTSTTGDASWYGGFTAANDTPLGSGGIPPRIQDVNGLFNALSAWVQWQNAGGPIAYDAAFSAVIGGYPKGAMLIAAAGTNYWVSSVDNNTSNPDAGGANWLFFGLGSGSRFVPFKTSGSFTWPAGISEIFCNAAGGGGGGAWGGMNHPGGGGGGGGDSIWSYAISGGSGVVTVTIGSGGAGGILSSGTAGANGGTTTISGTGFTTITLAGGNGAQGSNSGTSSGGAAQGSGGQAGGNGFYSSAASLSLAGYGGGTYLGQGGIPTVFGQTGQNPYQYSGAGGAGGASGANGGGGAQGYADFRW